MTGIPDSFWLLPVLHLEPDGHFKSDLLHVSGEVVSTNVPSVVLLPSVLAAYLVSCNGVLKKYMIMIGLWGYRRLEPEHSSDSRLCSSCVV